jgi:hypothetical protein
MHSFEQYLLQEYNLPVNVVCNKFSYNHSIKEKVDKVSKVPITSNIITVHIDSYDDKHNLLASHIEKFIDGEIHRSKKNKLVNIAPSEINNRFAAAKQSIASVILQELNIKLNDIQQKVADINKYCNAGGVIPNEFVNEPLIGPPTPNVEPPINKHFEF